MYIFILSFTTSHVTVYQNAYKNTNHRIYFNTSHVTVYHYKCYSRDGNSTNFNTSHVTVYHVSKPRIIVVTVFQYISCYCLSSSSSLAFVTMPYFNTSHVTVYPNEISICIYQNSFQYISCYCLSTPFL